MVIVGGGPAGLSAALVLGRACRKVLVCDEGKPRKHKSPAVHGYFSRNNPWAFIARGEQAVERANQLLGWTTKPTLCSSGPSELSDAARRTLKERGVVVVREEKISDWKAKWAFKSRRL